MVPCFPQGHQSESEVHQGLADDSTSACVHWVSFLDTCSHVLFRLGTFFKNIAVPVKTYTTNTKFSIFIYFKINGFLVCLMLKNYFSPYSEIEFLLVNGTCEMQINHLLEIIC